MHGLALLRLGFLLIHTSRNFVITMVTPVALQSLGYKYFIVFGSVGATIPVVIYFCFPETMGRNLEDIDLLFRKPPLFGPL